MKYLFLTLGLLLIIEGIPWFLSPRKMREALQRLSRLPDAPLRLVGLVCMLAGLGLVYLVRG